MPKGNEVNIPQAGRGYFAATQTSSETPAWTPERIFFSF